MMDCTRRQFLGTAAVGGKPGAPACFGLHPFIAANPGAVFIRRTRVSARSDAAALRGEGLRLGHEIFVPWEKPGIPLTHRIILKPNVLVPRRPGPPDNRGTDPGFYEGLVMALKDVGLRKFHFVEANYNRSRKSAHYEEIHERHGVEMCEPERRPRHFRENFEMTWSRVPDAVVYQRIPHYAPINEPDTWLLNIAKWRSHGMCLTQSVKNEQGLVVSPFHRFCPGWEMVTGVPDFMKPEIRPDVVERVNRYFESHRRMGYSRYDSEAALSPIRQEIWAQKTCDNLSVLKTGLSMIEAIYAFAPGEDRAGGETVCMPNLVMFGQDKFRLDLVGLWLGGHEPGNVHLYRIAKERGLSNTFNPWEVPVYEWIGARAVPRKLSDFPRTPLKTYYLRKDGEPAYHLVDEPFDYEKHRL